MIDSHSKKLLSRVRSHFTGKWPNFSKKGQKSSKIGKNLRKWTKSNQKKEGDHFMVNGMCSTINCQKGMIDSHSKKLLSRARSHFTNAKNLRKWPKSSQNK